MTKCCTKCGEVKGYGDFQKYWNKQRGKHYLASQCKPCRNAGKTTPEYKAKANARRRARYAEDESYRRKVLSAQRKALYGITDSDLAEMVAGQGGVCMICKVTPDVWHVDHCHSSGTVRGALCMKCNLLIGLAGDSPDVLESAIAYLAATSESR